MGISHSGSSEVTIYLRDVNDNDPVFQPCMSLSLLQYVQHCLYTFSPVATYSATLGEELPVGQSVATVMATDLDADSNRNLTYTISSVVALNNIENQTTVASHFSVNGTSGLVVTNVPLDYEFVQRYRVTVTATDDGVNQRSRYRHSFILCAVLYTHSLFTAQPLSL